MQNQNPEEIRPNPVVIQETRIVEDHYQEHESPEGPYTSTTGARTIPEEDIHNALRRFKPRDWGNVDERNQASNELSHKTQDGIVLGRYKSKDAEFWIYQIKSEPPIILLPHEY